MIQKQIFLLVFLHEIEDHILTIGSDFDYAVFDENS